jgi:hypothetical protein
MFLRITSDSQLPTQVDPAAVATFRVWDAAAPAFCGPAPARAPDRKCDNAVVRASHERRQAMRRSRNRTVGVTAGVCALVLCLPAIASADFMPAPDSRVTVGAEPYWVTSADFNGDGQIDLASANVDSSSPTGSVSVLLGQPDGAYTEEAGSPIAVGGRPDAVAVADFNGDGLTDMAVTSFYSDTVTILLRRPEGGFVGEAGSPIATGVTPHSVLAEDFDGDGRSDLAIADYGSSRVTILLRQPGGGFAEEAGSPVVTGGAPTQLAAADFNDDGLRDLATANFGTGDVTILLRQPSGGFEQEAGSPISVGTHPVSPVAGDFNGDSLPDLAVTNEGSDSVTVLLRQPGGGFVEAAGSPLPAGDSPYGMVAGNFGCDAQTDLAVTNEHSGNVTILLGAGDGTFAPAPFSPLPVGRLPLQLTAADLNHDRLTDLVVPNNTDGTVSILLQRCAYPSQTWDRRHEESRRPRDHSGETQTIAAAASQ